MTWIKAIITEWLLNHRLSPLLSIPPFVSATFWLIQHYEDLSFRDTAQHWAFWVATGCIFLVVGILCQILQSERGLQFYISVAIVFIGVSLTSFGVWLNKKPTLPDQNLVVVVASFTPIGEDSKNEAESVTHRIEKALEERSNRGALLHVLRVRRTVTGMDQAERENTARILGHNAHVVVWGEVRRDKSELYIQPHITICRRMRAGYLESRQVQCYRSTSEPDQLRLKERLSSDTADIIALLHALPLYQTAKWDNALEILQYVDTDESDFYRGCCFIGKSDTAAPVANLRSSIECFERILVRNADQSFAENFKGFAYLNRARALGRLATISKPLEAQMYLREAIETFRLVLPVFRNTRDGLQIQIDLARALFDLGEVTPKEEGVGFLRNSTEVGRSAISGIDSKQEPRLWEDATLNLAGALTALANRSNNREQATILSEQAVRTVRSVLEKHGRTRDLSWAREKMNLAIALRSMAMARRKEGQEPRQLINQGIAACREVLALKEGPLSNPTAPRTSTECTTFR